ncbi:MAG: phospholipase A [Oligoflexus sp.]|nr:phospholipase A [Oligoflexus sp.]
MHSALNILLSLLLGFSTATLALAEDKPSSIPDEEVKKLDDKVATIKVEDYSKRVDSRFALFAHHRTFLIPYSYVNHPTESVYEPFKQLTGNRHDFYQKAEAEFQISFFLPAYRKILDSNWDLNVAYSHHSWWQVYNQHWSKPFRETNYNPEIFFRRLFPDYENLLGISLFSLDVGFMHESNGQIQLGSRSWDRLFTRAYFVRDSYTGTLTLWAKRRVITRQDENLKILKYKGFGLLELNKAFEKITLETQINLAAKPGIEVSASYPLNNAFRWFVKVNKGYGQSLIEYDHDTIRFGAGIALENYNDNR